MMGKRGECKCGGDKGRRAEGGEGRVCDGVEVGKCRHGGDGGGWREGGAHVMIGNG